MTLHDITNRVRRHMDGIGHFPDMGDLPADEWLGLVADWRASVERVADELRKDLGAIVSHRPALGWAVTIGGVRSSSTSSLHCALQNWLALAERRMAKGRGMGDGP